MCSWLLWLVFGLVVGLVARMLHPGEDKIGFLPTIGVGIGGSFLGGAANWLYTGGEFQPAGFLWSVLGGVVLCFLYRQLRIRRFKALYGRPPRKW